MTPQPFDNRPGVIWMDGAFVPWSAAQAHVLTHAHPLWQLRVRGARAYSGAVFKLEAHTARLFKSAEILDMKIPFTEDQVNAATRELLVRQATRTLMSVRWSGAAAR